MTNYRQISLLAICLSFFFSLSAAAQKPMEGGLWKDTSGKHINAHGGNIIQYRGTYYWYGETRSNGGLVSSLGVSCYTSKNLRDWTSRGMVLSVTLIPDVYYLVPLTKEQWLTQLGLACAAATIILVARRIVVRLDGSASGPKAQ